MAILLKPLVTEKVASLNENGKFGFIVDKQANKVEIKKAVEQAYGVTVEEVNTMNYQGKAKARYTKTRIVSGRKPSFKKAIVKVKDGEFIDFYGNI